MANPNDNSTKPSPDSSINTGRPEPAGHSRETVGDTIRPDADPTQDIPSGKRIREDESAGPGGGDRNRAEKSDRTP